MPSKITSGDKVVSFFTFSFPRSLSKPLVGGMTKNPFYLAVALRRLGWKVKIFTLSDREEAWEVEGVNVAAIPEPRHLKGFIKGLVQDRAFYKRLLADAPASSEALVHSHHLPLVPFVSDKRIKVLHTAHGTSVPEVKANNPINSLRNFLIRLNAAPQRMIDKYTYRHVDGLIAVSKFQKREMADIYGVAPELIEVIRNGVDTAHYSPGQQRGEALKRKLGLQDKRVVLFVGRSVYKKGIKELLEAFKEISPKLDDVALLLVLGEDNSVEHKQTLKLVRKAAEGSSQTVYRENVGENELPDFYRAADICVFPSLGYESTPTVVMEAMSSGKSVLAPGVWGVKEVLSRGLLAEGPWQDSYLADQIQVYLSDPKKLKKMGEANRWDILNRDWGKVASEHTKLYESLRARQ